MQTAARYAAAIEILDDIIEGAAAEKALTRWARSHRFAGAKDRAALRDHVFDALRMRRSCAALGGAHSGRGLIIGLCLQQNVDLAQVFTGDGHAPDPLSSAERAHLASDYEAALKSQPAAVLLDCQDWVYERLQTQLGTDVVDVLATQKHRAPIFLRVNTLKSTPEQALASLAEDAIEAIPVADFKNALEVTANERKLRNSQALEGGLIELQDISSQASVSALEIPAHARILDYCAGGGGKSLALAAHPSCPSAIYAHDAAPARLRDLPTRAKRAGADISIIETEELRDHGPFDLVFVDAPCSGSGTWRRTPDAKWRLTEADLESYIKIQSEILETAAEFVSEAGLLCYATCSIFTDENEAQLSRFQAANPGWIVTAQARADIATRGDGFFSASLRRS